MNFDSAILNIEFYCRCHFLGENLIGNVYRVHLNATDGDQKSSLFLKVAPNNELKRSLLQINNTFVRETYAYDVVML